MRLSVPARALFSIETLLTTPNSYLDLALHTVYRGIITASLGVCGQEHKAVPQSEEKKIAHSKRM